MSRVPATAAIAAVVLVCSAPTPHAQSAAGRVVAIGDVHGSLDGFLAVLRAAGLVDGQARWVGGDAVLVQTGDVTDRGANVRGVLDLVRRLMPEAQAAGGAVVPVLGNHEAMNLLGEIRDVTAEICATFAGANADAVRDSGWKAYQDLVRKRARDRKGEVPLGLVRTEDSFRGAYARGCIEYRQAFGPDGEYGRWLRTRPIAARVGRAVFMHAGAPPDTTASLDALNEQARAEIARMDRFTRRLERAGLVEPWFRLEDVLAVAAAEVRWVNALVTRATATGDRPDLSAIDVDLVTEAAAILGVGDWTLLKGDGPLWYRGYATAEEAALDAPFTALLARWDVDRLVVGHTVNRDFRIRPRLSGRLFLIDTGMLTPVYKGTGSALEFSAQGGVRAIYAGGRTDDLSPKRSGAVSR